jgi:hypothetical protein
MIEVDDCLLLLIKRCAKNVLVCFRVTCEMRKAGEMYEDGQLLCGFGDGDGFPTMKRFQCLT